MRWNWNDYEQLICERTRICLIVNSACMCGTWLSVFVVAHEICLFVCLFVWEWRWNVCEKFVFALISSDLNFRNLPETLPGCKCWVWVKLATHADERMLQSRANSVWVEMTASLNISCLHNLINRIKSILRRDAFQNEAGRHSTDPSIAPIHTLRSNLMFLNAHARCE